MDTQPSGSDGGEKCASGAIETLGGQVTISSVGVSADEDGQTADHARLAASRVALAAGWNVPGASAY